MELKFYGDLLSASCRVVVLFMMINDFSYIDMQATAIRRCMFEVYCHAVASIRSFVISMYTTA